MNDDLIDLLDIQIVTIEGILIHYPRNKALKSALNMAKSMRNNLFLRKQIHESLIHLQRKSSESHSGEASPEHQESSKGSSSD